MRWPVRDLAHDRNDLLHDITADAGSGPRSRARRFHPGGFLFALVGPDDLLAFLLRPLVSRCDRFQFRRPGKLSGPPPFTPSLNVQRDDAHNNSGFR
jgi:hypothetical protein